MSNISSSNGVGGQFTQYYKYQNAVFHPTGRGFLGFQKVTSIDASSGKGSTTLSSLNTEFSRLIPYEQTSFVGSDTIGKSISDISIKRVSNNYSDKRIITQVNKVTTKDFLKNTSIVTDYEYDSFSNVIKEKIDFGNNIIKSINRTFINNLGVDYILGLPQLETVTSARNGNNWITSTEIAYTNDGKYKPNIVTDRVNNNIANETKLHYDIYGNVIKRESSVLGSGTFLSSLYEYDASGRYIIKETDGTQIPTFYSEYTKFGKPGKITDFKGNITSFNYDNWGRLIQSNFPDGAIENISISWASGGPTGALVMLTKSGSNKPIEKTYTDILGREVRTSVTRFNGAELKTDKQYDYQGRLVAVSLPSTGTPSLWNTYQYDQYDRSTKITAANTNTVTYAYNGNSITETKNKIASTKNMDAAGNVVSITDPGGTIFYTLRADGQPSSVTAPGGIVTSFEYDNYGRRTKIIDPSAGTKTFGYDQWGNLNKETDANGKTTTYNYDTWGKITDKISPEMSTMYAYNADVRLMAEVSNNGTRKDYLYDNLGRITEYKETTVDGKWLKKNYSYNQGLLASIAYTSNGGYITTEYNTYQNGYLKTTNIDGGVVIYDLQEENNMGVTTKVTSGPITRNYSFDQYNIPTGRNANSVVAGLYMNQQYEFNVSTGNLNYRKDSKRNINEDFSYDNLNRLIDINSEPAAFYDDRGNITQRDEMFTYQTQYYHYRNPAKPYTVTGIEQNYPSIPERQQQISYASFARPLMITENGITAHFTYEANNDRTKMSITNNGALVLNRYYLSDQYELDEKPGQTREKLYLGGDYYSAGAVLTRDNGGAWQIFYINSDYLGSVTHIVNSSGSVVAEYSYDAWGRMRNPNTQHYYTLGNEPELFLGRGYTGHEHLPMFGLINMNARLYDPVMGRFLAPDPYVQAPDMTQNFNRYTYALNNPLIYIDEEGEFWHIVAGAIIGGV